MSMRGVMDQQVVKKIIDLIVSTVSPDQIILFGSYARGDQKKNSDIDLLVLKKNLFNEREMTNHLYKSIYKHDITVPIDIISFDYDKYHEVNDMIGFIYRTIKNEGKVVYESL